MFLGSYLRCSPILHTHIVPRYCSLRQFKYFSQIQRTRMPSKDKYSDPKLRDEVKEEIKQSDKGGEPGQWSARKAQMMAKEYKNRGGDYNTPKESKDESQKNLEKWGDEEWQTKEGSGEARKEDGSRKRYLPKKAWEQMDEKEKKDTDDKKQSEGKDGKQFVGNTGRAKQARKKASKEVEEEDEDEDKSKKGDQKQNSQESRKKQQDKNNAESEDGSNEEDAESKGSDQEEEKSTSPGQKRGRKAKDEGEQEQKKQKTGSKDGQKNGTIGSKHDKADAPAQQGSKDRLPKKGQKNVHWKAMPGWVEGEVVEVVKSSKSVEGKQVKASDDDPKVVLKSKSSGKICVHKADNVYFD